VQQRGFAARPHGEFLREEPLSSTLVREQGAEAMLAAFFAESLDAVVAAGGLRADL
jgi:hypothetical protein